MRMIGIFLVIVLLTACGSAVPTDAPLEALAATITVTTTADEFNRDGDCSLREAMAAVARGRHVDGCGGAKSVGHTIVLAQNETYLLQTKLSQTEQLDSGSTQVASALPYVTTKLTIKDNGSRLKGVPAKYRRTPRLNL